MHQFFLSFFCGQDISKLHPRRMRRLVQPTEEQMQSSLYDLSEGDIENFFQEPLELMKLVKAISSANMSFQEAMEPAGDDSEYFQAFHFFSLQVRCIEFVLTSGELSALYFIRPKATWYFLTAAKAKIMNKISLDTPDGKTAEFVESATDHFVQMQHTKRLSEWSFYSVRQFSEGIENILEMETRKGWCACVPTRCCWKCKGRRSSDGSEKSLGMRKRCCCACLQHPSRFFSHPTVETSYASTVSNLALILCCAWSCFFFLGSL